MNFLSGLKTFSKGKLNPHFAAKLYSASWGYLISKTAEGPQKRERTDQGGGVVNEVKWPGCE